MLPFTSTPFLDAAPIPEKKLIGTEITRAQGQEITRKVQALRIPSLHVCPKTEAEEWQETLLQSQLQAYNILQNG